MLLFYGFFDRLLKAGRHRLHAMDDFGVLGDEFHKLVFGGGLHLEGVFRESDIGAFE